MPRGRFYKYLRSADVVGAFEGEHILGQGGLMQVERIRIPNLYSEAAGVVQREKNTVTERAVTLEGEKRRERQEDAQENNKNTKSDSEDTSEEMPVATPPKTEEHQGVNLVA